MNKSLLLVAVGALVMGLPARAQSVDCANLPTSAGEIPAEVLAACPRGPVPNVTPSAPTDPAVVVLNATNRVGQFIQNAPGTITLITPAIAPTGAGTPFINAADFAGNDLDNLYFLDNANNFRVVNLTTGVVTNLPAATAPPSPQTYTGMSWDYVTNQMYVVAAAGAVAPAIATATIGTINLTTGVVTFAPPVAPLTSANLIIDIGIHPQTGVLYTHDLGVDAIQTIDKTTGALTTVGPTGLAANFGQGMDFDNTDNTLYLYAVNTAGGNTTGLYTVNLTTGAATLVGPLGVGLQQAGDGASRTARPGPTMASFCSGVATTIPAGAPTTTTGPANPYPNVVTVSGVTGNVTDVNIRLLALSHTFPDDLDILLEHPLGPVATLMADAGGSLDLTADSLTFDDEAATPIPDATQIVTGSYQPFNYVAGDTYPAPAPAPGTNVLLSAFDGANPNGAWDLFIVDDLGGDVGSMVNWCVDITTGVVVANEPGTRSDVASLVAAPNPTSGRTQLRLTLPTAENVRVAVYDVMGRQVASLYEGPVAAGQTALTFDASSLRAGVYFVRASGETFVQTQRVTVAR